MIDYLVTYRYRGWSLTVAHRAPGLDAMRRAANVGRAEVATVYLATHPDFGTVTVCPWCKGDDAARHSCRPCKHTGTVAVSRLATRRALEQLPNMFEVAIREAPEPTPVLIL